MNVFMYNASENKKDDNLLYLVNYTEYPNSHINSIDKKDKIAQFFRNSIDGAVSNVKGELLTEKDN